VFLWSCISYSFITFVQQLQSNPQAFILRKLLKHEVRKLGKYLSLGNFYVVTQRQGKERCIGFHLLKTLASSLPFSLLGKPMLWRYQLDLTLSLFSTSFLLKGEIQIFGLLLYLLTVVNLSGIHKVFRDLLLRFLFYLLFYKHTVRLNCWIPIHWYSLLLFISVLVKVVFSLMLVLREFGEWHLSLYYIFLLPKALRKKGKRSFSDLWTKRWK